MATIADLDEPAPVEPYVAVSAPDAVRRLAGSSRAGADGCDHAIQSAEKAFHTA
jgi:hypothetical protein